VRRTAGADPLRTYPVGQRRPCRAAAVGRGRGDLARARRSAPCGRDRARMGEDLPAQV